MERSAQQQAEFGVTEGSGKYQQCEHDHHADGGKPRLPVTDGQNRKGRGRDAESRHNQKHPDRAEAILRGIDMLDVGDALLIAGKGHESGQIVGDSVLPFDDVEQASVAVAALEGRI